MLVIAVIRHCHIEEKKMQGDEKEERKPLLQSENNRGGNYGNSEDYIPGIFPF